MIPVICMPSPPPQLLLPPPSAPRRVRLVRPPRTKHYNIVGRHSPVLLAAVATNDRRSVADFCLCCGILATRVQVCNFFCWDCFLAVWVRRVKRLVSLRKTTTSGGKVGAAVTVTIKNCCRKVFRKFFRRCKVFVLVLRCAMEFIWCGWHIVES